jgi:hypothetical protein
MIQEGSKIKPDLLSLLHGCFAKLTSLSFPHSFNPGGIGSFPSELFPLVTSVVLVFSPPILPGAAPYIAQKHATMHLVNVSVYLFLASLV